MIDFFYHFVLLLSIVQSKNRKSHSVKSESGLQGEWSTYGIIFFITHKLYY